MKLLALTIWQPWATLVIADCKPYEFRTWPAPRPLWGKRSRSTPRPVCPDVLPCSGRPRALSARGATNMVLLSDHGSADETTRPAHQPAFPAAARDRRGRR